MAGFILLEQGRVVEMVSGVVTGPIYFLSFGRRRKDNDNGTGRYKTAPVVECVLSIWFKVRNVLHHD